MAVFKLGYYQREIPENAFSLSKKMLIIFNCDQFGKLFCLKSFSQLNFAR